MKLKDLEKRLQQAGWVKSEGGNHSKWRKDGKVIPVPRHREIKENLAKEILKQAELL